MITLILRGEIVPAKLPGNRQTLNHGFSTMNAQTIKLSLACLAILTSAACLRAATIIKANNTDSLNLITSWTNGIIPGVVDVARWDANITGANSVALGADASWGGIIVTPTREVP